MRRSAQVLASMLIAGFGAGLSPASAQDASGPSTSGGNLPYISGKPPGPHRSPETVRPAPAAKPAEPAPVKPVEAAGPDRKPTEAAAPAAPQEPASTEVKTTVAPRPTLERERPEAPAASTDGGRAEPAQSPRKAAEPARPKAQPPQRRSTETARREEPRGRSSAGPARRPPEGTADRYGYRMEPPTRGERYGRGPAERPRVIEPEDDYLYGRPAAPFGFRPYAYVRPYREGPALRSFEPSPQFQYRRGGSDMGCHSHAFPTDDMRFHRDVQCHWHEDPADFSLRYVR